MGTTWVRGTAATVIWATSAYHRGGYAYRLCGPVEKGKEWMVNEQCFRDGHLNFVGKTQEFTTRICRCIKLSFIHNHLMDDPQVTRHGGTMHHLARMPGTQITGRPMKL